MSNPIITPVAPEFEGPAAAEIHAEVPDSGTRTPDCPTDAPGTAQRQQDATEAGLERGQARTRKALGAEPFRFDDPYWDDVFDSYHNPTLRTCCR